MTDTFTVIKGSGLGPHEVMNLAPARMGVLLTGTPRTPEVEGQRGFWNWVECPWCGSLTRARLDPDNTDWYVCGCCGRYSRP